MCLVGRAGASSFTCFSIKFQIAPRRANRERRATARLPTRGVGIRATRGRKEGRMIILRYDCMSSGAAARPNTAGQFGEDCRR